MHLKLFTINNIFLFLLLFKLHGSSSYCLFLQIKMKRKKKRKKKTKSKALSDVIYFLIYIHIFFLPQKYIIKRRKTKFDFVQGFSFNRDANPVTILVLFSTVFGLTAGGFHVIATSTGSLTGDDDDSDGVVSSPKINSNSPQSSLSAAARFSDSILVCKKASVSEALV